MKVQYLLCNSKHGGLSQRSQAGGHRLSGLVAQNGQGIATVGSYVFTKPRCGSFDTDVSTACTYMTVIFVVAYIQAVNANT